MADLTIELLTQHKQSIICKRATLGMELDLVLSHGGDIECLKFKMLVVDGMRQALCNFIPGLETNCLTDDEACKLITHIHELLD